VRKPTILLLGGGVNYDPLPGGIMALQPTPENFRAEIARFYLTRADVCEPIGMNLNTLTMYVNGVRPLTGWAAHNIGYGINKATGRQLIDVNMARGVLRSPVGRRPYADTPAAPKPRQRRHRQEV
jgi:hypothetical protein